MKIMKTDLNYRLVSQAYQLIDGAQRQEAEWKHICPVPCYETSHEDLRWSGRIASCSGRFIHRETVVFIA